MNKSLLERTLKAMIESRDDVASTISEIPPWKADYEHRLAMATEQLAEHDACIKDLKAAIAEQAKPQEPIGWVSKKGIEFLHRKDWSSHHISNLPMEDYEIAVYTEPQTDITKYTIDLAYRKGFNEAFNRVLGVLSDCLISDDPALSEDYKKFSGVAQDIINMLKDNISIQSTTPTQEPIGYLAFRNGEPVWDEGCVFQDAVYPIDGDDDRVSVAIYTHPQALEPMSEEEISAAFEDVILGGVELSAIGWFTAGSKRTEAHHIGVKK